MSTSASSATGTQAGLLPPDAVLDGLSLRLLSARQSRVDSRWQRESPADPFNRLLLVREGEAVVSDGTTMVTLTPGMSYLIPAHTVHSCRCNNAMSFHWAHFHARLEGRREVFAARPGVHARRDPAAEGLFQDLLRGAADASFAGGVARRQALLGLLRPFEDLMGVEDDPSHVPFRVVLGAIENEPPGQPLTIANMAALLGLSPNHFTRSFTAVFAMTPIQYRLRRRLAKAQDMLLDRRKNVDEVGQLCGFSDGFHLSKAFHKVYGYTPSAYRRRAADEANG